MSDHRAKIVLKQDGSLYGHMIRCPACTKFAEGKEYWDGLHFLHAYEGGRGWSFNGDLEKPTFSPSLLVYASPVQPRCHSFITDGRIAYQSDCDHASAGKTEELPVIASDRPAE